MSYLYSPIPPQRPPHSFRSIPVLSGLGWFGNGGTTAEVNQAIRSAKAKRDAATARYTRLTAGGITTPEALIEKKKWWDWASEVEFLESLKSTYETQAGVPLNFRHYPVTKKDPKTGRSGKDNPWRLTSTRQAFESKEAGGSFCLGTSRGMAFRSIFGLDRPTNKQMLTNLKQGIENAKAKGDVALEAKFIISRLVSHLHDPGSLKQFNGDIESRYGVKNVLVKSVPKNEAFDALKKGAPIISDLGDTGWHWVLVQRSPLGQLWANDPLSHKGIRKLPVGEMGSRFELIVDSTTGEPITPRKAAAHLK